MERVLIALQQAENQRLLSEWLAGRYEVAANESLATAGFDLCILDEPTLARHREEILARRAHDAPVFLPFLLVVRREHPPAEQVWSVVDEVLVVPAEKAELHARIESLLRARRFSVELNRRYVALQQYEREKDTFLSLITHELRSPLTSILGYAEMLEDQIAGPLTDGQRDFVRQIETGTQRVNRLVTDLLDFARVETGTFKVQLEPADLHEEIAEAMTSLRPQAEAAGVSLAADVPETLPTIRLDAQRIVQVFVNLIGNALKFTPKGGRIDVRVKLADGGVRCEVSDTGPGIAPEDVSRLFRRFSQLESGARKGGSGLGLSISKTIVEAHGGHIGVESTPGHGATFCFTLPAAPQSETAALQPEAAA